MARYVEMPTPPGVSDLLGMVEFMKDPKKYSKYIEELNAIRKKLNTLVGAVGPVEKIQTLLSQAKNDRKQGADVLAAAISDAADVRGKAQAYAKKKNAELAAKQKTLDGQTRARQLALDAIDSDLKKRETNAIKLFAQGEAMVTEAEAQMSRSLAIRAEYEAKLKLIKETADQLGL